MSKIHLQGLVETVKVAASSKVLHYISEEEALQLFVAISTVQRVTTVPAATIIYSRNEHDVWVCKYVRYARLKGVSHG